MHRDEALLREGIEACAESLRSLLPEDVRLEIEREEALLAHLLARIEERRAA